MKKLIGMVSAVALFGLSSLAIAAEEAQGIIESVDAEQNQIVLDTGEAFTLGEGVSAEGLQPGDEVTVSYEEQEGQMVATSVEKAAAE